MNQSDPHPTREPRRIKLTSKAVQSKGFAATRQTELPSGDQSVSNQKPKRVVRRGLKSNSEFRSQSSDGPSVDCKQTQAQVQEEGLKDKGGKKSEEAARPIRVRYVDTGACSDFDNGSAEGTRRGSSQFTSQVFESLPMPQEAIESFSEAISATKLHPAPMEDDSLQDDELPCVARDGSSERIEQNLDTASPAPTESTEGGPSKMTAIHVAGSKVIIYSEPLTVPISSIEGTTDIELSGSLAVASGGVGPIKKQSFFFGPAVGYALGDGGVDEARQFSLEAVEQKLDVGTSVTKDFEGASPSEVMTQLDGSDRGVVLPESLEILPIIDAPSSERLAVVMSSGIQHGNGWMPAVLQGALEDEPPANTSQLLNPMTDTAHPQQLAAFAAGFSEKWTKIRTLSNRIHQDFGISFIIAARRDLLRDDDDIMLHATEGLDRRKFLERLEACVLNSNSDAVNDVVTEERVQSSEGAEDLGKTKTKTKTDVDTQILNELKDLLTESARGAGLNLLANNGRLMWATVGDIMAEKHVYLDNYPYILMPHENRQQKWKGIQNLRKSERKELIKALRSQANRCQFIKLPKAQRGDINSSKHPLIICAPPPADSPHKQGLRYFRNGLLDRRGHPRISTSSKTYNGKLRAESAGGSSESDGSADEERDAHGTHLEMRSSKKRRADSDSEEEVKQSRQTSAKRHPRL